MVIYEGIHLKFLFVALLCAMLFTQKEFRFAAFFSCPIEFKEQNTHFIEC